MKKQMRREGKRGIAGRRLAALVLAGMMAASIVGCGSSNGESTGEDAGNADTQAEFTVDEVVMTYVTSPLNVPSILDQHEGYYEDAFEELGLGLTYSEITSGSDQTAALASGDVQILNAIGGSSVILAAAAEADIAIISMYSRAPQAFAMFSNDKSIDSPEDLKGLTIAGPKGTNLHELLVAYLDTAGMTTDDVNYVSMDIPSAVSALEGGSVDVALAGGAAAYQCEKSGKHKITDGEGLIAATICTACSRDFAEKNPEIIEKFRETQKAIVDDMNADTDGALQITADELELELVAVKDMYAMYDFSVEISDEDLELLQDTEEFLYDSGMIENHVDVKELVL